MAAQQYDQKIEPITAHEGNHKRPNLRSIDGNLVPIDDSDGQLPPQHPCVMKSRIDNLEESNVKIFQEMTLIKDDIKDIKRTLGESPDPIRGTDGSGISGLLCRIADHRPTGHTTIDDDESDDTKVQNRIELVARARAAEAALEVHKQHDQSIVETGKIKVEKWKVVLGILGVLLGPGVINVLVTHAPNVIKLLMGH